MQATVTTTRGAGWLGAVGYVAVPLLLSMIPGSVAFAANPDTAVDIGLTQVPVPPWVFIVVWAVIHAGMGLAVWRLRQSTEDYAVPAALVVVGFLQTNLFWLSDGLRSVAAADATGLLLAVVTTWAVARQSRAAARWLLPWLIWMPITLAVKIAVLV
jgi:tryptophan-rich sensory protein